MEFILTGDTASGREFERLGLINKALPKERVLEGALQLATRIAAMSSPVVAAAKQAVLMGEQLRLFFVRLWRCCECECADKNRRGGTTTAESTHLDAGLVQEKALYYSTFSMHDCQEGLGAFLEKREPVFEHC